ncbi:MAG: CRTAC1 family protein [Pseudomonadota bacterium]
MAHKTLAQRSPSRQPTANPFASRLVIALLCLLPLACSEQPNPRTQDGQHAELGAAASGPTLTTPAFTDIAEQSGLSFFHHSGATAKKFFPEIMGSGGALVDYDNDGDLDVVLIQSGRINQIDDPLFPFVDSTNHVQLFRNDLHHGAPTFTNVTDTSGLVLEGYGMGVATGDLNNDGYADLYLTNVGTNALFINNGNGTFTEADAGIADDDAGWSTSASFLDYDLDGHLDLFITRYVDVDLVTGRRCTSNDGQRDYCSPDVYVPLTDLLLKGDGSGRLSPVERWHAGGPAPSTGLGVIAADFNSDGWTDLYVANDKKANQLWINQANGLFEETAVMNGSAFDANGKAEASMGVTSGDVDADGDEDLFITHLKGESNTLYLNQGNAMFIDSTIVFRLSSNSLPSTGFGTGWIDPDNDGDLDLFAANGAVMIESSQINTEPFPYVQANQLFEQIEGLSFVDASAPAGFADERPEISRGAAFGDIDNDGDIDILVTNNEGPVRLLRNDQSHNHAWLGISVQGVTANRDAAGARVGVERNNAPTLWRRVGTDGSYLSANDKRVLIGLGVDPSLSGLVVSWPDGQTERFPTPTLNTFITLVQGEGLDFSSAERDVSGTP